MKNTFDFIFLKWVNKYGILRNNKNIDKLSQNNFHNSHFLQRFKIKKRTLLNKKKIK